MQTSTQRTPKLQLNAEQLLTGDCWISPKKDTPHRREKEKPQEDSRRGKITFRIKPHTHQRCSEGSNKPVCTRTQRPPPPQRLSQNCVWVSPEKVQVRSGLMQGQGLWVQQTWVWHKPSWTRSPLTHHRATRTYSGLGNRLLEGTNRILCSRIRRKEQGPHKRLTQTCPWVPRSLWWRRGSVVSCCRGHWVQQCVHGTFFEGGRHYLHYLLHSLASHQTTGRKHSLTNRKLD